MGNRWAQPHTPNRDNDIEKLVQQFLRNRSINLSFLPDSIEKKLYNQLLSFGIEEIREIVSTVKIQFLNQEITLDMHPLPL